LFSVFINSWKVKEIRTKMLYTLLILAIVRLGAHIALPGIDVVSIKSMQSLYSTGTLYNIIAGGAGSMWSIFAMGIGPYITSSIIMQLLTVAIPRLEQLNKEGEEGRKYMNSSDTPIYSKRKNLFALNYAKNNCSESMILCEGYMDVIALHQAGFENAVATLGTAITPEQARLMGRYTKKVVISYDSDNAGQNAANKAIKLLTEAGIDASVLKMSGAKDPDEYIKLYGAPAFSKLLDSSRSPFRFKVDSILAKYNINEIDQKVKAVSEIAGVLADIPQKTERELYLRQIAEELDVKPDNIDADVKHIMAQRQRRQREDNSRSIMRQTAGYADRVNPDYAKNVQGAKAEEHILALLMLYEEHRRNAMSKEILSSDDFITDFGKRVFEKILELESEGMYSESCLGESFTVDEMSRLKKIQLDRAALSNNSGAVFMDCVSTLKKEKADENSKNENGEDDILLIINRKKQNTKRINKK